MNKAEDDFLLSLLNAMDASQPARHTQPPPTPAIASTSAPTQATQCTMNKEITQLLDGAEDWSWDDDLDEEMLTHNDTVEIKPILEGKNASERPVRHPVSPHTRCVVHSVELPTAARREKVLLVAFGEKSKDLHQVILQADWAYTDISPGDVINVIGNFVPAAQDLEYKSTITITVQQHFIVLHPDLLVTATAIANASYCQRRPHISTLLSTASKPTPVLIWGTILHEIMQACLQTGKWDDTFIHEATDRLLRANMDSLVQLDVNVDVAKAEIGKRAQGLREFSRRYIGTGVNQKPRANAILSDSHAPKGQKALLAICGLHATEEDIWSPRYGIKGKLDASLRVVLEESEHGKDANRMVMDMPFEIKTGTSKSSMEHRAQTMLYTVLMEERYGTQVPAGLLYYTQSEELIRVSAARNELRALIQSRNNMVAYMHKRTALAAKSGGEPLPFLPPTEDDERTCRRCYVVDGCMLYRKAVENVEDTTSEIAEIYRDRTGHLTPPQCAFFKDWEALISLEEQEMIKFRKELWTMGAEQREKTGRCLANMELVGPSSAHLADERAKQQQQSIQMQSGSKVYPWTYTFRRRRTPQSSSGLDPKDSASLINGHISRGDAITVSVEPDLLAYSRGYVLALEPEQITVGVERELDLAKLISRNHDVEEFGLRTKVDSGIVFRLDRDEVSAGISRIRNNLAQLFFKDGDKRRLESVVDLKPPRFKELETDKTVVNAAALNASQRLAMKKVLAAEDYAILLGMPGTGKTTTIAEIIKELVRRGKSVLLTSYTHSAVDTILMKLLDVDFDVLRLGNSDRVHPAVHKMTLAARPRPTSVGELERQLLSPQVVATTCLSIDHTLFSRRRFDVCIVDEASQITLPTCLGPLRFADKFVLVGDHFQLPPLVKSVQARKGGLDVSLFRRLSEAHPEAVVELQEQYRMNEDVMKVSNALIYENRLKCGNEEVAKRSLTIDLPRAMEQTHQHGKVTCTGTSCWIRDLVDANRHVVFVDTDSVPAKESKVGDLVQNTTEAAILQQTVKALLHGGVQESQIGVISLYRQQVKLLSHMLDDHRGVEILTADRSQGRDKDCIIISMVRSNDSNN
ncbi:related to DNA helicase, partial [Serendipita indica DSM 11827]